MLNNSGNTILSLKCNKYNMGKKITNSGIIACSLFITSVINLQAQDNKIQKRPNIIFITTDQQSASMMSCAGNPWLKTPAMDYIAQNGVRFTRAYCTNPVCSPSRVSLMTGRFAGIFNDDKGDIVRENDGSLKILKVSNTCISEKCWI